MPNHDTPSLTGLNLSDESLDRWSSMIGEVLVGKYVIEDIHGEGACAVVYSAKELSTDRVVAVKALKFREPEVDARFAREAEIHSKLKHPNIVEPIDFIVLPDGQSFFVMELLEGTDLSMYLDEHVRLDSLDEVVTILSQVCDAIEYAHFEGVIHRDVKPDNIVVLENVEPTQIKVLDFGLAKIEEDLQRLTKTGVVLGSPAYMSPEQCMGTKLDQRSDVYSLAVVAYELITGALPFVGGDNPLSVMEAHCDPNVKPQPISQLRASIPNCDNLQSVLDRALETDAALRYQSIEEFREDLAKWWHSTGGAQDSALFRSTKRTGSPKPIVADSFESLDDAPTKVLSINQTSTETKKSGDNLQPTRVTSHIKARERSHSSSKNLAMWIGFTVLIVGVSIALAYFVLSII